MTTYVQHIIAAIRATRVCSPTVYSWFGMRSPRLPAATRNQLTAEGARQYLRSTLRMQLYRDFYCRGGATPAVPSVSSELALRTSPFVEALSAANCGQGYWQDGWEAIDIVDDRVVVTKGGLTVWAQIDDCRVPQHATLAHGLSLCMRFPKEARRRSPGFYLAEGDQSLSPVAPDGLIRLYWHLTPAGAVHLMREVTRQFNQVGLPFQLKVLHDPNAYTRCDAGVLYLRKRDYQGAADILSPIYPALAPDLLDGTPVFTKPLAPGLGLAEDPGNGESFGLDRCLHLAEGMLRAQEQGRLSLDERLEAVIACFSDAGIGMDRPYLNRGSDDNYEFRPSSAPVRQVGQCLLPPHDEWPAAGRFLDAAKTIGERLTREAIWYQERCTWLGAEPAPRHSPSRLPLTYRPLRSDLYAGTSGVAIFLAELARQTDDEASRRTALAAMRQALRSAEEVPPVARLALYTGWVGIAFAAVRVGAILEEPWLVEQGALLLHRALNEQGENALSDLLSGLAGTVAALLVLHESLNEPALLEAAIRLGDELLCAADTSDASYAWPSLAPPNNRPLTGLSHGAAGIGYALLELFGVTAEPRFRHGAEMAFAFERHWFDTAAGNWPDLRGVTRRAKPGRSGLPFMTAWCHGAPGIALSRLRAYQLLGEPAYKSEAITALLTTKATIGDALKQGIGDCSLCHGLLGNADVLLHGSRLLDGEWSEGALTAQRAAITSIETFGARDRPWPCGAGAGETPGLMLGLAGIGYFFLRLHDPMVPSLLLLRREEHCSPGLRRPTAIDAPIVVLSR